MVGLITNGAELAALELLTNYNATPENLVLKLFSNDYTPTEASVVGDLTEATFTGYSAITLTGASWTGNAGSVPTIEYAQQSFISSADQTAEEIYGYYMIRAVTGDLIGIERFASSVTIELNGDTIRITPIITADGS